VVVSNNRYYRCALCHFSSGMGRFFLLWGRGDVNLADQIKILPENGKFLQKILIMDYTLAGEIII